MKRKYIYLYLLISLDANFLIMINFQLIPQPLLYLNSSFGTTHEHKSSPSFMLGLVQCRQTHQNLLQEVLPTAEALKVNGLPR